MPEHCDIGEIDRMVRMADAAGIPRDRIAPVLQTFGQSCTDGDKQYWLPTRAQFRTILARWDRLAPRPPLEISSLLGTPARWACPTLADATGGEHPDLQSIMQARNTGATGRSAPGKSVRAVRVGHPADPARSGPGTPATEPQGQDLHHPDDENQRDAHQPEFPAVQPRTLEIPHKPRMNCIKPNTP